eukprot:6214071-Pleurochrysis_carterae.AAC.1
MLWMYGKGNERGLPRAHLESISVCMFKFPVRVGFKRDSGTKAAALPGKLEIIGCGGGIQMGLPRPSVCNVQYAQL